ncbi:MAG: hypothetical protein E7292_05220 [Lachnospiraceae bacterium]|nr:hypothetical protein [Lachnospiraceae bacterium]
MTTTSVKDVGSVLSSAVMPAGAASKVAEESFQSVWNSQAGTDRADSGTSEDFGRTVKPKDDVKPGDDLRAKDNSRKDIGTEDAKIDSDTRKADELTEEDLEKVAEIVGTATAELIQQIADTFGISVEEVQAIMADMDLDPMDLLQGENLSSLLLQVSGAESSLALLTNEQLYADYQMLMEQGRAVLEECSEEMGMTPDELVQAVAQMLDEEGIAEIPVLDDDADEPVVEITTEDEGEEATAQSKEMVQLQNQMTKEVAVQTGNGQNEDSGAKEHSQQDTGNTGNLVLQTIRNENAQPQAVEVQAPANTWSAETQDMMRQIMDYMRIHVKPDVSSLEMQLHPASLGTLQIHVASEGGVLTANFITENETVKAALESQMIQLKESFAEQGVKVEAIEVTVQTHQFEQNLEQGRGRQPENQNVSAGRTRTRRINLNALEGVDGTEMSEELDEEDRITAEMMAANGQTVDYTA